MSDKPGGVNWHVLAIFCIAIGVFLVGVNRTPVPTVDGAVRAEMARNVVKTGQLWPIMYEGKVFVDHPPLYVWLTAASFKIFGVNDFAANFMPRLFAALVVIVMAQIALAAGYTSSVALLATLILCLTRDFVLSSVRGYIEPLLEFWIYLGFWFVLRSRRRGSLLAAAGAGVSVWLAAYSKGPVALWPFLFFLAVLVGMFGTAEVKFRRRVVSILVYLSAFAIATGIWAFWNERNGYWPYWKAYWFEQILGSALQGRGGAQHMEPLYFLEILGKFYWPWLPFLIWSIGKLPWTAARAREDDRPLAVELPFLFFVLGAGFVGGFSLVKWKFWYYIAPAYPAFALLIAATFRNSLGNWLSWRPLGKGVFHVAVLWVLIGAIFPIRLHRERVPEVMVFKDAIVHSEVKGPVWFLHNPRDHNMIGTSGIWYFERIVEKVAETDESAWAQSKLQSPAWIITGTDYWKTCKTSWCRSGKLISTEGPSALVYYEK